MFKDKIQFCFTLKYLTLWLVKSTLTVHRWRFQVAALCETPHTPGRSRCAGARFRWAMSSARPMASGPGTCMDVFSRGIPTSSSTGSTRPFCSDSSCRFQLCTSEANSRPGAQVNSLWADVVAGQTSSPFEPENRLFRNNETDCSYVSIQRCELNLCAKLEYCIKNVLIMH